MIVLSMVLAVAAVTLVYSLVGLVLDRQGIDLQGWERLPPSSTTHMPMNLRRAPAAT